jgi:hypothetical protein
MNKIVRVHYPAAKLPDDLRDAFPPGTTVRITLEPEQSMDRKSLREIREEIEAARRSGNWPKSTSEEAVARIRALREEWD